VVVGRLAIATVTVAPSLDLTNPSEVESDLPLLRVVPIQRPQILGIGKVAEIEKLGRHFAYGTAGVIVSR
jgi:hypothetical protein